MNEISRLIKEHCSKMIYQGSPNGSSYHREELRSSDRFKVEVVYNSGYQVVDTETMTRYGVSFLRKSVGSGADFGVHYCTRDQVLVAFLSEGNGAVELTDRWSKKYQRWGVEMDGRYVFIDNSGPEPWTIFRDFEDWNTILQRGPYGGWVG